jgi:hypothetical protein
MSDDHASKIDPSKLPIDAKTGEVIAPRAQPGYYPGFSTLSQRDFWDEATRKVVLDRVERIPEITFFTAEELPLARAVYDRIIPQDDRDPAHRIAVVNYIDEKLTRGIADGYRFDDMPDQGEAQRLGLRAIDAIAKHLYGKGFVEIDPREQDAVLLTIRDGKPPAAHEIWARMNVAHYWAMLVQHGAEAYYAHPYAWDEIGFGGPAYPRGYMRLEGGLPEPWEVDEKRNAWNAPASSLSDAYKPLAGEVGDEDSAQGGSPGQAGTH